jgi:hypothetical protein
MILKQLEMHQKYHLLFPFESRLWDRIQKIPKMRSENILIESLSDAQYFPNEDRSSAPAAT